MCIMEKLKIPPIKVVDCNTNSELAIKAEGFRLIWNSGFEG